MLVKVNVERAENPRCPTAVFCFTDWVDIIRAELLTEEDLYCVPYSIKQYIKSWWVNIPDEYHPLKVKVGGVNGYVIWGETVNRLFAVRPVLRIDTSRSGFIKVGDVFTFGGKRFYFATDTLAFCVSDIGDCAFNSHVMVSTAQDYNNSDIKQWIDNWFSDSMIEACRGTETQPTHMKIDEIQLDMKIANEIQRARLNMTNENYADFLKSIINYAEIELAETNKQILTENCLCNQSCKCCCKNRCK